jgi:hypothetical protein
LLQADICKQQAASNKQQATSNKQQATSNKQQATSNKQQNVITKYFGRDQHPIKFCIVTRICESLLKSPSLLIDQQTSQLLLVSFKHQSLCSALIIGHRGIRSLLSSSSPFNIILHANALGVRFSQPDCIICQFGKWSL